MHLLGETDWHTEGISLTEVVNSEKLDLLNTFRTYYDVVFIDVTGHANLASIVNLSKYLQVKNLF